MAVITTVVADRRLAKDRTMRDILALLFRIRKLLVLGEG
jgi:hypothetical protein